jgi:hypothetical protein
MALIVATHPNPKYTYKIAKNICHYSEKRNLDPYLVLSTIRHESNFTINAKSHTKDLGLMQINSRIYKPKCNLLNIRCNINEGTKILYVWKKACANHKHKSHWLRHYNWRNKKHHLRVLWLTEAYKKNKHYLFKMIKERKYMKLKIKYNCIKNLCGALGE